MDARTEVARQPSTPAPASRPPSHGSELLRLVGADTEVPLVTGRATRYVNLDYAASAPALSAVRDAVEELLSWYSSVHRGAGFKSRVSTAAYEGARESIRSFVNAPANHAVVITRNTTDSINLLASSLPPGTRILAFAGEHHANLLPWKRNDVRYLPVPMTPGEMLDELATALTNLPRSDSPHLVTVTGASNVTGEIWPIRQIASLAHEYGARVLVDAAQLAPHAPIDMTRDGIDYLALSGHKLYAPYGAGALVGEPDSLRTGDPFLRGGGAVRLVTLDETVWADLPDRQEAGSPNVVGAVALGVACDTLARAGMERIATEEAELLAIARDQLEGVDGFRQHRVWGPEHPRVGLLTFSMGDMPYDLLAAVLSAEHGIGVRHGCFCAHPLMMRLLDVNDAEASRLTSRIRDGHHERLPGAVRMSLGLASTVADVAVLVDALRAIGREGPRWTYAVNRNTGEYEPDPDPRNLAVVSMRLAEHAGGYGESA